MVRPSNTCLLPRCGVPMDEGCTQPLSSDPMINLNTTVFSFRTCFPFVRNLHNLESLALTIEITKKAQSKVGESNTHKTQNLHTTTHTSHNLSRKGLVHGGYNKSSGLGAVGGPHRVAGNIAITMVSVGVPSIVSLYHLHRLSRSQGYIQVTNCGGLVADVALLRLSSAVIGVEPLHPCVWR
jgi:hypothetical protein